METDDESFGALAVEHFFDKGIRSVAYCGESEFNWSRWRGESFLNHASAKGMKSQSFEVASNSSWAKEGLRLARWLKNSHVPVGCLRHMIPSPVV